MARQNNNFSRKRNDAFGIATFLAMFIFTIATSLTNPFYGMSEAAMAQGTTTSTLPGNCYNPFTEEVVPCDTISYIFCPSKGRYVIRCIWRMQGYSYCSPDMQDLCPGGF